MAASRRKRRENRMKSKFRGAGEFPAEGRFGGSGLLMRSSATARQVLRSWKYNWTEGFSGPAYAT